MIVEDYKVVIDLNKVRMKFPIRNKNKTRVFIIP